jgi:GTPase SAR1 family protein
MARIRRYFLGLDFLIVGQDDAGKTSFYNFLRLGQFADQWPTNHTTNVSQIKPFNVNRAGNELDLQIRKAWDIPGSLEPSDQVKLIHKETPKVLLVFTSADKPESSQWLRSFLVELRDMLADDSRSASRLICLIVVLNKTDLIIDKTECDQRISEMKGIVCNTLQLLMMNNVRLIDIIPCTLYLNAGGEKAANAIVLSAVEAVRKNQRLVPR